MDNSGSGDVSFSGDSRPILVAGGAGFIGSALVRRFLDAGARVVNVDCLTYAGNLRSLDGVMSNPRHVLERVDIASAPDVHEVFVRHQPRAVFHLAAESHVDRSIDDPDRFVRTNVLGTLHLLESARMIWTRMAHPHSETFRFIHVSTDEVFGSLGNFGSFSEHTPYDPSSPYSASKAGGDHLARAWQRTYGLPVVVTNCSNNYGPRQHPEKLIPLMILSALHGLPLPVYGDGRNVRDWLHVDDHVTGLISAWQQGRPGETYLFGGAAERRNIEVVRTVCAALDELQPDPAGPYSRLIRFVPDRPGHDYRYAVDSSRTRMSLHWQPARNFEEGIRQTVRWYLDNQAWWTPSWTAGHARGRPGAPDRVKR